jgi:hypothetical protein
MKRVGLFLVAVFSLFLYAPSVSAEAGTGILITEAMTASSTSASSEFVELYNQSDVAIDVTGWKIQYSSATGTSVLTKATLEGAISARGFLLAATSSFQTEQATTADVDLGSGFSGTAGRVRVVNSSNEVIDALSYGATALSSEGTPATAPSSGESLKRETDADTLFTDDDENSTDFAVSDSPFAQGGGVEEIEPDPTDVCPATPEIDLEVPAGYIIDEFGECVEEPVVLTDKVLYITELLANAAGSDTGNEFIEIYNPNDEPIGLDGYTLFVGPNYEKSYSFPSNLEISAHQYLAFYNSEVKFTLVNSSSRAKLVAPAGNMVSETESYQDPGDGMSWSLIDDKWVMTEKATPDAANEFIITQEEAGTTSSARLPCPAGKFRNPATNRCKNIASSTSSRAPCATNQTRNPVTNRCKKISSTSSSLTPCKVGQVRNAETNRCRKIEVAASAKPCQPGYERNSETNRCRKVKTSNSNFKEPAAINPINLDARIVTLLLIMTGGYAAYEYRADISNFYNRLRDKRGKPRPPG